MFDILKGKGIYNACCTNQEKQSVKWSDIGDCESLLEEIYDKEK